MKRIFYALFACLLLAMPALAGQNVRQLDTGGAVWVDGDGNTIPVGDSGLVVYVDDFGQASTSWIVSNRKGNITKIYSVVNTSFTGDTVLDFGTRDPAVASTAIVPITGVSTDPHVATATTLGLTASGSAGGDLDTFDASSGLINVDVTPGMTIYIHSDGGASTAVSGHVVLIIE